MKNRSRLLQDGTPGTGNVLYWMSREQRISNNAGLIFASYIAKESGKLLEVLFVIDDTYPNANLRSFSFMTEGLQNVKIQLEALGIPFYLRLGKIPTKVTEHINLHKNAIVVIDFSPLRHALSWKAQLLTSVSVPVYEVDGHNIVPCWIASDKQEYAARTFRPKINRHLVDYLYPLPEKETLKQEHSFEPEAIDWKAILSFPNIDLSISPTNKPAGEEAAHTALQTFIDERIKNYAVERNHIRVNGCSELSPYIHFGQISALEVALEVIKQSPADKNREVYLEQLIVRRELAENFCYYNPNYDSSKGFPSWAQKSLLEHQSDVREYLYSLSEFEQAQTHDILWNEAQNTLVESGTMHNYLRMYWGKKILEWSATAEEAMQTAVYLNDKYQLDGRDPNGYTGCAWCIGGVHDRPWFRHTIFGNVRYMGSKKLK
ncbi:deoxyribodipyrimidine photo-lyase [uncultured Bacteroides sp.]|uniref:deoxyribodipyrimidine photo-lyase n=1 Tax=uncultured Bacteroides sp. TaxID=162156 RepID=UPI002AAA72AD|nr:deoxyribodipyrimidine photo-lyase [uncultured Bacteroides sp.]